MYESFSFANFSSLVLIGSILNKTQLFKNLKIYLEMYGLLETPSSRLYMSQFFFSF